jgi:hypothetical protein
MWMTDYIRAVKRGFRDQHGFGPTGGTNDDPIFADGTIPDGEYPMEIDGKIDRVRLVDGSIDCCNFEPKASDA